MSTAIATLWEKLHWHSFDGHRHSIPTLNLCMYYLLTTRSVKENLDVLSVTFPGLGWIPLQQYIMCSKCRLTLILYWFHCPSGWSHMRSQKLDLPWKMWLQACFQKISLILITIRFIANGVFPWFISVCTFHWTCAISVWWIFRGFSGYFVMVSLVNFFPTSSRPLTLFWDWEKVLVIKGALKDDFTLWLTL